MDHRKNESIRAKKPRNSLYQNALVCTPRISIKNKKTLRLSSESFLIYDLACTREEVYRSRDEEPCEDRNDESDQSTDHSFFGLVDSWAISCDTRVDLHLDSMVDERKYSDRTSDTEENIDHIDYDRRDRAHIDIASTEGLVVDTEDIFSISTIVWRRARTRWCNSIVVSSSLGIETWISGWLGIARWNCWATRYSLCRSEGWLIYG